MAKKLQEKKRRKRSKKSAGTKKPAPKKKKQKGPGRRSKEGSLPQNILPVGERVIGDKNIYIAQGVYRQIHKFTEGKTENESGGILVGRFVEEFGKKTFSSKALWRQKYCEATPQTLTFTHETWEACDKEIEKKSTKANPLSGGFIRTRISAFSSPITIPLSRKISSRKKTKSPM